MQQCRHRLLIPPSPAYCCPKIVVVCDRNVGQQVMLVGQHLFVMCLWLNATAFQIESGQNLARLFLMEWHLWHDNILSGCWSWRLPAARFPLSACDVVGWLYALHALVPDP